MKAVISKRGITVFSGSAAYFEFSRFRSASWTPTCIYQMKAMIFPKILLGADF